MRVPAFLLLAFPLLSALLVTGVGCQGAVPPARVVYGNERGEDAHAPVAIVDGRRLSKGALSDFWFDRYREEYSRTVRALVDQHVVSGLARGYGLSVPPAVLDRAVAAEVDARRKQIRSAFGKGASLESEVRRAYGVDSRTWQQRILRPRLEAQLLMERVIRWEARTRERIHARVIVVHDPQRAAAIVDKLNKGADFSLTAMRESKDPSARAGGDLPSFARGDLAFRGVEERLFRAVPGRTVGPLEVRVDERPQWQIYKVVTRHEAWAGTPAALRTRLEQDLVTHPMTNAEFERWRVRAHRDAGVKYYAPDGRVTELR